MCGGVETNTNMCLFLFLFYLYIFSTCLNMLNWTEAWLYLNCFFFFGESLCWSEIEGVGTVSGCSARFLNPGWRFDCSSFYQECTCFHSVHLSLYVSSPFSLPFLSYPAILAVCVNGSLSFFVVDSLQAQLCLTREPHLSIAIDRGSHCVFESLYLYFV